MDTCPGYKSRFHTFHAQVVQEVFHWVYLNDTGKQFIIIIFT